MVVADGLAGHEVAAFDGDLAGTKPGQWLAESATSARAVLRVNSFLGAASAASTGTVLALLPCFVTELWPTLERATEKNALTNEVWLLVHEDVLRTARVRAVFDHLVGEMAAAKDVLRGAPRSPGRGLTGC